MDPYKIAIVGTGYVGLVVGTCFAEYGRSVVCIDRDKKKIDRIKAGKTPFYEPGLDTLVQRNIKNGRLTFSSDTAGVVKDHDIILLAVGTPPGGNGQTDLAQVLDAAKTIGKNLSREALVVIKSTVPVGTTMKMKEVIAAHTDHSVHVSFNPEFLREGNAVEDFMKPDRTIVGYEDEDHVVDEVLKELYAPFISPKSPFYTTDITSAEMIKYAANSMLATKISFMNDLAMMCEKNGADVEVVKHGMGLDQRIGNLFLNPGIGFGGSCFPKDVKSLLYSAGAHGVELPILKAVMAVNLEIRRLFIQKVLDYFNGDLSGRRLAVWGLSFKPNTDDIRESPSVAICEELAAAGAELIVYDPEALENARSVLGESVAYSNDSYSICEGADALLVMTEWNEFRSPDWKRIKDLLAAPVLFDGRNIYSLQDMDRQGWTYFSIGRKAVGV